MKHMNEADRTLAIYRFTRNSKPNRLGLAIMVDNLATWADNNSDGWAYWSKPRQAAQRAIALIESTTWAANEAQEEVDATAEEVAAAVRPVKAFLTRMAREPHGLHPNRRMVTPEEREYILRSVQPLD